MQQFGDKLRILTPGILILFPKVASTIQFRLESPIARERQWGPRHVLTDSNIPIGLIAHVVQMKHFHWLDFRAHVQ